MKSLIHVLGVIMIGVIGIQIFSGSSIINTEEWKAPAWADTLSNPLEPTNVNINAGKKLFNTHCWSCHGMTGKGNGPASEVLLPKPADLASAGVQKQADGVLFWKITYGRGAMTSYGSSITSRQRWQLVCYLRQLGTQSVNNNH